jgi:hypothetical protein
MNSKQIAEYLEFQAQKIRGNLSSYIEAMSEENEEVSDKGKPYEGEPDYKVWTDETTGYKCLIRRNPRMKFLTGYVMIPEDIEIDSTGLKVHGRVNWNKIASINFDTDKWCKDDDFDMFLIEDLPNKFTGRMIGFDCAHEDDYALNAYFPIFASEDGIYRDMNYVTQECESLAKQIKKRYDK